jgi:hypothetical protein
MLALAPAVAAVVTPPFRRERIDASPAASARRLGRDV